jgi:hypothetical protein
MHPDSAVHLDALLPTEMAAKAEEIGVKKAAMDVTRRSVLAVLARAFIFGWSLAGLLTVGVDPSRGVPRFDGRHASKVSRLASERLLALRYWKTRFGCSAPTGTSGSTVDAPVWTRSSRGSTIQRGIPLQLTSSVNQKND